MLHETQSHREKTAFGTRVKLYTSGGLYIGSYGHMPSGQLYASPANPRIQAQVKSDEMSAYDWLVERFLANRPVKRQRKAA